MCVCDISFTERWVHALLGRVCVVCLQNLSFFMLEPSPGSFGFGGVSLFRKMLEEHNGTSSLALSRSLSGHNCLCSLPPPPLHARTYDSLRSPPFTHSFIPVVVTSWLLFGANGCAAVESRTDRMYMRTTGRCEHVLSVQRANPTSFVHVWC